MVARAVIVASVVLRVGVAVALLLISDPATLNDWDIGRFAQVANGGVPWVDQPVEYPPVMVAVITVIFGLTGSVVAAHRVLVLATLVTDLLTAAIIGRAAGPNSAAWYLGIGLVLLPEQYLRLEVLPGVLAAGALAVVARRPAVAGALAAMGAAAKVWPALLVVGFVAARQWRAALATALAGAAMVGAWAAGFGTDAVTQVVALRGATGWQIETLPGSVVALIDPEATVRRELDAYRIGTLIPWLVTVLRLTAIGAMITLAALGWRRGNRSTTTVAVATLGAVAALLVTAPLLSTQFLLWCSVPAAVAVGRHSIPNSVLASGVATVLTGLTMKLVGAAGAATPWAAAVLLSRDVALVVVVVTAAYELATADRTGS